MSYEKVIVGMVRACSEIGKKIAQKNAMAGVLQPLYLYYKKATATENGVLVLVPDNEEPPQGYELATGEGLRGHIPYDNYYQWVHSRIGRLPVLAANA